MSPLVSVCIQTYQHAPYIKDCLESVLNQKTNFEYEVLLGEDCSTDGTREICMKYAEQYPDKIKLFLHSRDTVIYINGRATGRYNFINNLKHVRGKYIAICDGDDYWSDTLKLQKQIEFLENNNDYSMCFHAVDILTKGAYVDDKEISIPEETSSIVDLAKCNYIRTVSCVYRNNLSKNYPDIIYTAPAGDYVLHMLMAEYGKIKYFPEKMAVYRIHEGGRWSQMSRARILVNWIKVLDLLILYFRDNIQVFDELKKQRISLSMELLMHYQSSGETKKLEELFLNIITLDAALFIEHYKEVEIQINLMTAKYYRLINHPIVGNIINFIAWLKRDPTFRD